MNAFNLSDGWQVRAVDPEDNFPATFEAEATWLDAIVPGSIHQDLLRVGKIPDPFYRTNENAVQWVGETDWLYRCVFDVSENVLSEPEIDLCFDGLDTFATVWLNDQLILTSTNMFIPARIAVKDLLQPTGNRLYILFESALRRGKEDEAEHGTRAVWNGDASRVYVRKAQYHYGWDWGPTLLTAGLWRPVRVESYTARIAEIDAPASVSDDLGSATIPVQVELVGDYAGASLLLRLTDPDDALVAETLFPAEAQATHTFEIANPALWYPNGSGTQPRYTLSVWLLKDENTIWEERSLRLGLRRLRLVQEPLPHEPGTSFYFEINNLPLFSGGANWIPADSFTPAVTADRYREWLQLAAAGNMNMLRVWGGGVYEEDVFYDVCDELGLLVWQDFLFACGIYPAHPDYLASVRAEAEANVKRLRHHASIVLWCGNNEDYQIAESQKAYDPKFDGDFSQTAFPAREIYERLLPEVCARLDPTRPYWPGSPYGGKTTTDGTVGDRHTWEIWHGNMADYQKYGNYAGRFVSEFGMEAAPHAALIDTFTLPEDRASDSAVMNHHNKAGGGVERLQHYLTANLSNLPTTLDDYIYATQFIQSEAMAAGVEQFRGRWGASGGYATAGALIWQLNDCWPVTSWALVDYELRPKAAYYRVKRALAPISLHILDGMVYAVNTTAAPVQGELHIRQFTLEGYVQTELVAPVKFAPLRAAALLTVPDFHRRFVSAAYFIQQGEVVARAAWWPSPREVAYPDPGLVIERHGDLVTVSSARPARGVLLMDGALERWSDNMLDVMPDDPQTIQHDGALEALSVRWLGAPETIRG